MKRVEEQLRELASTPPLRPPLPINELTRRSSQLARRRRIVLSAIVVVALVAVFVIPFPHLNLVHHPANHPTSTMPKKPVIVPNEIEPTPNATGPENSSLSGVSCTSASACVAVGSSTDGAGRSRTLVEAWNGTTWAVEPSPNPGGRSTAPSRGCRARQPPPAWLSDAATGRWLRPGTERGGRSSPPQPERGVPLGGVMHLGECVHGRGGLLQRASRCLRLHRSTHPRDARGNLEREEVGDRADPQPERS